MNKRIENIVNSLDDIFSEDWPVRENESEMRQEIIFSEQDDHATISLHLGKKIDSFDASTDDDRLTIDIPEKNQKIIANYDEENNYLSITTLEQTLEEDKRQNYHEKYTTQSRVQRGRTLNFPIKFKKAKIEYEDGLLTILIPKKKENKQKSKKIKVQIK